MPLDNNTQIIGLAAAYLVIETVKFLIPLVIPKKSSLTVEESNKLAEVSKTISRTDTEGKPLIYSSSKETFKLLKRNQEILTDLIQYQEEQVRMLSRVLIKLDQEKGER